MLTFESYNKKQFPTTEDVFSYWSEQGQYIYPGYEGAGDSEDCMFDSKESAEQAALEVLDNFKDFPDEIDIYRTVYSETGEIWESEALGHHWSYEEDAALRFARNMLPNKNIYMLSGTVNKDDVNWSQTVKQFISFTWGEDGTFSEHELYIENPANVQNLNVKKIK